MILLLSHKSVYRSILYLFAIFLLCGVIISTASATIIPTTTSLISAVKDNHIELETILHQHQSRQHNESTASASSSSSSSSPNISAAQMLYNSSVQPHVVPELSMDEDLLTNFAMGATAQMYHRFLLHALVDAAMASTTTAATTAAATETTSGETREDNNIANQTTTATALQQLNQLPELINDCLAEQYHILHNVDEWTKTLTPPTTTTTATTATATTTVAAPPTSNSIGIVPHNTTQMETITNNNNNNNTNTSTSSATCSLDVVNSDDDDDDGGGGDDDDNSDGLSRPDPVSYHEQARRELLELQLANFMQHPSAVGHLLGHTRYDDNNNHYNTINHHTNDNNITITPHTSKPLVTSQIEKMPLRPVFLPSQQHRVDVRPALWASTIKSILKHFAPPLRSFLQSVPKSLLTLKSRFVSPSSSSASPAVASTASSSTTTTTTTTTTATSPASSPPTLLSRPTPTSPSTCVTDELAMESRFQRDAFPLCLTDDWAATVVTADGSGSGGGGVNEMCGGKSFISSPDASIDALLLLSQQSDRYQSSSSSSSSSTPQLSSTSTQIDNTSSQYSTHSPLASSSSSSSAAAAASPHSGPNSSTSTSPSSSSAKPTRRQRRLATPSSCQRVAAILQHLPICIYDSAQFIDPEKIINTIPPVLVELAEHVTIPPITKHDHHQQQQQQQQQQLDQQQSSASSSSSSNMSVITNTTTDYNITHHNNNNNNNNNNTLLPSLDSMNSTTTPPLLIPSTALRQSYALHSFATLMYPVFASHITLVQSIFGVFAKANIKAFSTLHAKATRPDTLAAHPWMNSLHLRDSLRGKVRITSFTQIRPILNLFLWLGYTIVKLDVDKFTTPKQWGWMPIAVDLRYIIPHQHQQQQQQQNQQQQHSDRLSSILIELYFVPTHLDIKSVKYPNHLRYEKWRHTDFNITEYHHLMSPSSLVIPNTTASSLLSPPTTQTQTPTIQTTTAVDSVNSSPAAATTMTTLSSEIIAFSNDIFTSQLTYYQALSRWWWTQHIRQQQQLQQRQRQNGHTQSGNEDNTSVSSLLSPLAPPPPLLNVFDVYFATVIAPLQTCSVTCDEYSHQMYLIDNNLYNNGNNTHILSYNDE